MNFATAVTRAMAIVALLCAPVILLAQPGEWHPRGVGGGGALFLPSFSPYNANELFMTCDMSQMFHSTNLGRSWEQFHHERIQVTGAIGRMQFTSDSNIRYTIGMLYDLPTPLKSVDGGQTWKELVDDPTQGSAYSLWADPASTQRLILTSYSDLYFSADGGSTFTKKYTFAGSQGLHVGGVLFDGTRIFVGTNAGLIRSNDNGAVFAVATTPGIPVTQAIVSMAGGRQGGTVRLYAITATAADVYAGITGADHASFKGIYSLDAGGGGWSSRIGNLPGIVQPWYVGMALNNVGTVYIAGSSTAGNPTVFKTTDNGATWTNMFRIVNNDNINTGWCGYHGDREWTYAEYALGLAVGQNDANKVMMTDLGFAHVSTNGGNEWNQVYVDTADQTRSNTPTQPGKSYHSIGMENTTCWQVFWGDSSRMIGAFSDIRAAISNDAGETWGFNLAGIAQNSLYRIAAGSNGTLYAATSSVHDMYQSTTLTDARIDGGSGAVLYSNDKGRTWQKLHDFPHPVVWVATDPNNPSRLYASVAHSTDGGVYVSNDIGSGIASTWTKLAAPPRTEGHPFNIVVLNDGTLICTYSGRRTVNGDFTNSSGLFISADGGAHWADRSSTQMHYWTKDVVIDPNDPTQNTWYVGVFSGWGGPPNGLGGLYKSTDRGLSWGRFVDADRVTSCTINPLDRNEMYITTEGAGLLYINNATAESPLVYPVESYPFRQPERVFFNPYKPGEVWVTSFGNGMKVGTFFSPTMPPQAPNLVIPKNDSTGVPINSSFFWSTAAGATSYQLQLSTSSNFNTRVIDTSGLTTPTLTFTGLTPSTKYYWRVRGANGAGSGVWSATWHFTTAAPGAPTTAPLLVSPANDSTGVPLARPLYWGSIAGVTSYQIQLSTDPTFATSMVDTSGLAGTSLPVTGLAENTKYYWRARGANAAGPGPWSLTWNFTTLTLPKAPVAPQLVGPGNGASSVGTQPLLQWDSVPGATSYHLQLSMRQDFSVVQVDKNDITGLSFTPPQLALGTTYYWRVAAINGVGQGPWSETWSFTTFTGASVEILPGNGAASVMRSYPNPVRGTAVVELNLPHAGQASVTVIDGLGREVATIASGVMESGRRLVEWSATGLPSGEYYYRLSFDGKVWVERVRVVR